MAQQPWYTYVLPKTCIVNVDFDETKSKLVVTITGEGPPPAIPTRNWTLTLPATGPMALAEVFPPAPATIPPTIVLPPMP